MVKKIAISVPVEVMKQVDRAAKSRGVTRSRFITGLLRRAAQARTDEEITRQLRKFFSDEKLKDEQRQQSEDWLAVRSHHGTEW